MDAMLDGGGVLKGSLLKPAAEAETQDALVEVLRRSNMDTADLEEKSEGVAWSMEDLTLLSAIWHDERRSNMRRMSHLNPLGIPHNLLHRE